MDVPVAFAIAVAFAASVWATISGAGEVYYDSIAMFVFLLLTARYLQSGAQAKAAQAVEQLARLVPAIAERVPGFPATRATEPVAVAQLRPGDHVLVRAGSPIPADGCVVEGASRVDEALLTGESRPVLKACRRCADRRRSQRRKPARDARRARRASTPYCRRSCGCSIARWPRNPASRNWPIASLNTSSRSCSSPSRSLARSGR